LNPDLWTTRVHYDQQLDSRRWRILSFGLGLRALLHPCAPRDVHEPSIAEAVAHSSSLWNQEDGGWAEEPGLRATTSGSYAVIAAAHTLKRAWPFDPAEQLGLHPRLGTAPTRRLPRAPRVLYIVKRTHVIRVTNEMGETLVECKVSGGSQWIVLCTLAERHSKAMAKGATDQNLLTVTLAEFASLLGKHDEARKLESVRKTIRRLNAMLAREARKWSRDRFVDLIEDHLPPGTTEHRAALEEIDVRFVDELPPEPTDAAE
jgi:hypothetical protein